MKVLRRISRKPGQVAVRPRLCSSLQCSWYRIHATAGGGRMVTWTVGSRVQIQMAKGTWMTGTVVGMSEHITTVRWDDGFTSIELAKHIRAKEEDHGPSADDPAIDH